MIRKAAYFLAAVLAAGSILAGCAGGGAGQSGQQAGQDSKNPAVQIGVRPETIDPALNTTSEGANIIIHLFETLLVFDENNQLKPGQAERYEISEDGLTYTFHLRPDLKWSDGSPLTAEDFVYSFRRVADPAVAAPFGYSLLCMVKGYEEAAAGNTEALAVSAPDANTFVVELETPCVYFDKICASAVLSPVKASVVEEHGEGWAVDASTYICNGAFKIQEWVPGSYIQLAKNEYFQNQEAVNFDTLRFVFMEDANGALSAYRSGELLVVKEIPTEEIPGLQGSDEFYTDPILGNYYLSLNLEREPFTDVRVRQALSLAVDRRYVSETLMQGIYSPSRNIVGPGISDAEPGSSFEDVTSAAIGGDFYALDQYEENLEQAKKLLAEAGYPGGEGFPVIEYMTNDSGYHKALAEYLQSAWSELGIPVEIKIMEWSSFTSALRNGDFDIARNGWGYDYDDPSCFLDLFETGSAYNVEKYSNPEYDRLIDEARITSDTKEHYRLLHEAEELLMEDAVIIPIACYNDYWMQSPKLTGTWHSSSGFWYFMYGKVEE